MFSVGRATIRTDRHNHRPRVIEHAVPIIRAVVPADPRKLRLTIPTLAPATIIEFTCRRQDATGAEVERVVTGTIYRVPAQQFRVSPGASWPAAY